MPLAPIVSCEFGGDGGFRTGKASGTRALALPVAHEKLNGQPLFERLVGSTVGPNLSALVFAEVIIAGWNVRLLNFVDPHLADIRG